MAQNKPNILFILTDQNMANILGCYGGDICKTPNIDRLADDGILFNQAYTSCTVCTPARASIQTGLYPFKHGMQTNIYTQGCMIHELPDTPYLLSRQLGKHGYSLGYTGKWHMGLGKNKNENNDDWDIHSKDFTFPDYYINEGGTLPSSIGYEADDFPGHGGAGYMYKQYRQYLQANNLELKIEKTRAAAGKMGSVVSPMESTINHYLGERAIHYMDEFSSRNKPFFFMLNFWGPHAPYYAHKQFVDQYNGFKHEPWGNFYDCSENKPSIHDIKRDKSKTWDDYLPAIQHYYALMTEIDYHIGRLVDYLKESKLYDNTIIIFSADHGESLGIHGGLHDKAFFMYEETSRIPLIVKPIDALTRGKKTEYFIGTTDFYATILDLAGITLTGNKTHGRSFKPLLSDTPLENWPDCVVTEGAGLLNVAFTQRMIRYGELKYVFNCGDIDELYDLKHDPYEMKNLLNDEGYTEKLEEIKQRLARWMSEHHDPVYPVFVKLRM